METCQLAAADRRPVSQFLRNIIADAIAAQQRRDTSVAA
jgi:hypothetical protein